MADPGTPGIITRNKAKLLAEMNTQEQILSPDSDITILGPLGDRESTRRDDLALEVYSDDDGQANRSVDSLEVTDTSADTHMKSVLEELSQAILEVPNFQIGEYLMTLPQHLEPFLKEEGNSPAVQLLGRVCRQTSTTLADIILSTKDVSPNTAKQIAVDIAYLGNVLEDLGQTLPDPLSQMATLLKLPSDAYHSGSAGCSPRFVAAIREMRNIPSS